MFAQVNAHFGVILATFGGVSRLALTADISPVRRPGLICGQLFSRAGLVVAAATGAAVFLHLGLEQVSLAVDQLVTNLLVDRLESGVIVVVVVLDDLEGPAPFNDVAAHDFELNLIGEIAMASRTQTFDGIIKSQIGHTAQPMEGIQEPASILDDFERLGELAGRVNGGVVNAGRALVG